MNMARIFLMSMLLCASMAGAEERVVIGIVKEDATAGELDRGTCYTLTSGARGFQEHDSLIVVGSETCSPRYGNKTEDFYVVASRGQLAHIRKSAVFIPDEKLRVLEELKADERDAFVAAGKDASVELYKIQLQDALAAFAKTAPMGVALMSYGLFDVSEYTQGTGFRFRVANPTKKTIKYVTASLVGLNAVKDPVRTLRGTTTVVLRGVGPIEPSGEGSYSWDYVWHTDLPEYVKWVSLRVEYTDGSSRVVSRPQDVAIPPKHVRAIDSASE